MAEQKEIWPPSWDPLEVAYFAGLFDGEGSVALYWRTDRKAKGRKNLGWFLNIANTDPRPLVRAHQLFGGGFVPQPSRSPRNRMSWVWYINGSKAERFLAAILPFLRIKKAQAEIFLALRASMPGAGRRRTDDRVAFEDAAVKELKRLKKEEFTSLFPTV